MLSVWIMAELKELKFFSSTFCRIFTGTVFSVDGNMWTMCFWEGRHRSWWILLTGLWCQCPPWCSRILHHRWVKRTIGSRVPTDVFAFRGWLDSAFGADLNGCTYAPSWFYTRSWAWRVTNSSPCRLKPLLPLITHLPLNPTWSSEVPSGVHHMSANQLWLDVFIQSEQQSNHCSIHEVMKTLRKCLNAGLSSLNLIETPKKKKKQMKIWSMLQLCAWWCHTALISVELLFEISFCVNCWRPPDALGPQDSLTLSKLSIMLIWHPALLPAEMITPAPSEVSLLSRYLSQFSLFLQQLNRK